MFNFPPLGQAPNPMDWMQTGTEVGMMLLEAQSVIALRVMGMTGLWSVTNGENSRMMSEKGPAFADSARAAIAAVASGKSADKIVTAAVGPLRRKTRSNVRRLSRRGPKIPSF